MSYKKNVHGTKRIVEKYGIKWDSKDELEYYEQMILPALNKGEITDLKLQPEYILQEGFTKLDEKIQPIKFKGDFQYRHVEKDMLVVVDVKGFADNFSIIKKKLFNYKYPEIALIWISKSKKYGNEKGWILYNELQKIRKESKKKK